MIVVGTNWLWDYCHLSLLQTRRAGPSQKRIPPLLPGCPRGDQTSAFHQECLKYMAGVFIPGKRGDMSVFLAPSLCNG